MVKLLIGHKGSGKTNQMVQLANDCIEKGAGSIIFINKNHRLMYELNYKIPVWNHQLRSRYRNDLHRQHSEACGCFAGRSAGIPQETQRHFGDIWSRLCCKRKRWERRDDRCRTEQLRSSQLGEQTETEIEQKGGGFTVFFDRYDIWSRKSGKNKH